MFVDENTHNATSLMNIKAKRGADEPKIDGTSTTSTANDMKQPQENISDQNFDRGLANNFCNSISDLSNVDNDTKKNYTIFGLIVFL